jgi:brefeldin A-inhibited guanine nucleotide-exchange protein
MSALEILVAMLRCMSDWTRRARDADTLSAPPAAHLEADGDDTDAADTGTPPTAQAELAAATAAAAAAAAGSEGQGFERQKQYKMVLDTGIEMFHRKPKKGIAYLVEKGLIESTAPVHIAQFLMQTEGVSKTAIGEYVGEQCVPDREAGGSGADGGGAVTRPTWRCCTR